MKVKRLFVSLLTIVVLSTSCTENARVKRFGGTGNINLPRGQKLITVTWKETQVWYLTRPMRDDETPETYSFQEESNWGMIEGTYLIHESK
jgi:hypothetical protein